MCTTSPGLLTTGLSAYFDLDAKIKIAKALDEFGVDCEIRPALGYMDLR